MFAAEHIDLLVEKRASFPVLIFLLISMQKIISGENILNPTPIRFGNLSLN